MLKRSPFSLSFGLLVCLYPLSVYSFWFSDFCFVSAISLSPTLTCLVLPAEVSFFYSLVVMMHHLTFVLYL